MVADSVSSREICLWSITCFVGFKEADAKEGKEGKARKEKKQRR